MSVRAHFTDVLTLVSDSLFFSNMILLHLLTAVPVEEESNMKPKDKNQVNDIAADHNAFSPPARHMTPYGYAPFSRSRLMH